MLAEKPPIEPYSQIVVCATQRSGSTMVCEDITNSGILGKPEEWFLSWNPEQKKDWQSELDAVKAKGSTENGIFSVKLMANQLRHVDACLSGIIEPGSDGPYPHLRGLFRDAVWVWVRRQDTVDQAISHYIAKKRGVYHTVEKTSGFVPGSSVTTKGFKDKDIPYGFQEILSEWSRVERDNLVWNSFFDETGISPYVIWYEHAPKNAAVGVAAHFWMDRQIETKPRNLVKLPSRRNMEIRKRFLADLFAA